MTLSNLKTLALYAGQYRSDTGPNVEMIIKDGALCAVISGEGQLDLIALDRMNFRPTFLDDVKIKFKVENEKSVGFEFQEGTEVNQYVRVDD